MFLALKVPDGAARFASWLVDLVPVALRTVRVALLTAEDLPGALLEHREAIITWLGDVADGVQTGDHVAAFPVLDAEAWHAGCDYFRRLR
jgi:hypothetical protein